MTFLKKITGKVAPKNPAMWTQLSKDVDLGAIDATEDELIEDFNKSIEHGESYQDILELFEQLVEENELPDRYGFD